jgi:uncharacterized protein (DUF433 family)
MVIVIGKCSFNSEILEGTTKDEAVQMFPKIRKDIVLEAWKIANPSKKKSRK